MATLYRRLADRLRRAIYDNDLPPGAQLPTEAQLMEQHSVSRATVRLALGVLTNEGLITATPGRGTFVRERRPLRWHPQKDLRERPSDAEQDAWMDRVRGEGRAPHQSIRVSITQPPSDIATRLELDGESLAVVRHRVRYVDEEPYAINDSYFPLALAQDTEIMAPYDIARGANTVLEESGHPQVRLLEEISARMPMPEEEQRLSLERGTPVAVHVRTGYDKAGDPVRVAVTVLPGDKHTIVYELDRP